jgi:DNA-binding beta-propeller fold protein YncE
MTNNTFTATLALLGGLALAGCPATSDEVRPPADQLFFPAGLGIAPDESVLFVTNANSELRYDSGTVSLIDLDAVDSLIDAWLANPDSVPTPSGCADCCERDGDHPETLICNELVAVDGDATVRIGNFSTNLGVQGLDNGDVRLLIPVRGDPSITWIDYRAGERRFDCGGSGSSPLCDGDHRMIRLRNDLELPGLTEEPWSIHVDSGNQYAIVAHLTTGTVSLVDSPSNGDVPIISDALGGLFATNPSTGARGATGVAVRFPGSPDASVYVTSRAEARIQTMHVHRAAGGLAALVPGEFFFLDRILPSTDSRGMAFSADGQRGYVVSRDPPTVQIIDTETTAQGYPRNQVIGAIEICRQASVIKVGDFGAGEKAYVSCFQDSRVWVLDLQRATLDAIINVGRGANNLAMAPGRGRLFVTNFLEDTVSVIDTTPGSPTENRVVLQLGRERQSGGE